jgi:hypothetical protein
MAVRQAKESDYPKIAELYKGFYHVHNVFEDTIPHITKYIKSLATKGELLIYGEKEILAAGFLIEKTRTSTHKLWKLRHFAFKTRIAGKNVLKAAEEIARKSSTTSKVEISIACSECGLDFYKQNGYSEEGRLVNHYRFGETTTILGKSIG